MDADDTGGFGKSSRRSTTGEDQSIESERVHRPGRSLDRQLSGPEIDCFGPRSETEIESEVLLGGGQKDPVRLPFAGEDLLGERRAVIGPLGIGVDDVDGTGVTLIAQSACGIDPGEGRAHDGDG